MTDHDDTYDDIANLEPGQPAPFAPRSTAELLSEQLMALEARRIDPTTPPLADDERAQWADLYQAIKAAGDPS